MSLHLLSPDTGGTCCECRSEVCDPCSLCPTGPTVNLALAGLTACCNSSNQLLLGLESLNTSHVLAQVGPGEYELELADALTLQSYLLPSCQLPGSSLGGIDVTIAFLCLDDFAELIIRISNGGDVLFFDSIETPATEGDPFVFNGSPSCTAFQPFTFGGTAILTP
ncbi:MAG: hypothetical protein AAGK14_01585 [Verrucomicrobiota bacterium]